jgi:hypothetical protein
MIAELRIVMHEASNQLLREFGTHVKCHESGLVEQFNALNASISMTCQASRRPIWFLRTTCPVYAKCSSCLASGQKAAEPTAHSA